MRTTLMLLALVGCGSEAPAPAPEAEKVEEKAPEKAEKAESAIPAAHTTLFAPLPEKMEAEGREITEAKVELGRMLYYETRLSKNHDLSCNSCHQLDNYGVDNEPTSPGHKGQRGDRNSPTVYNAALHLSQFWDGRAADVEEQAGGPVLNPVEMAVADEGTAVTVLKSIPGYEAPFKAAFPGDEDPITYANMTAAIGAFERGLVTPGPFDKYLAGDATALTDAEKKGLETYINSGCTTCHAGVGLGGAMYQKLGLVNAYETEDIGRAKITGNDAEKFFFKVPSLRNVAKTGPYFHDGSVASLEDAVQKMAHHQLGKELSATEIQEIVTFLNALTGEIPTEYVKKPELPESGPNTPAADPA